MDGVDYGRIEENVSLRLPIDIQIGERVFRGNLENGATLSKEEVDAIIKQVMKEMGLNAGMLRFSEEIIRKAAKNLGFNPMVAFDLGQAFLLGATGLDNALSVYDVATGKAEAPGALANYAIGDTLSSITGHAMGGMGGMDDADIQQQLDDAMEQLAGNWPDNEYTKLVPKPDFEIYASSSDDDIFSAMFLSVTMEQIKAYAEKVKAAGFTVGPQTEDQEVMGMVMFNYSASNSDGYRVSVFITAGTAGISIEKP